MLAKVIERSEGRVVVAFEAETPAEGLVLGLVATEQPEQRTSLQTISNSYLSQDKPPTTTITLGSVTLHTVQMIQGR